MSGTSLLQTAGRHIFQLGYTISPIILTGGIAANIGFDGYLPIMAITQLPSLGIGLMNSIGNLPGGLDSAFATFYPLPGSSLLEYDIGQYPLANQAVAANAIIAEPLRVSMMMVCPVNSSGGYSAKLATLMLLQYTLTNHCQIGGTFIVATPSFIYENCLLTSLRDVSTGETEQRQYKWQFDFIKPLITQSAAQGAQNLFTQKLTNGLPNSGATSGVNAATPTLPVSSGLAGSAVQGTTTDGVSLFS